MTSIRSHNKADVYVNKVTESLSVCKNVIVHYEALLVLGVLLLGGEKKAPRNIVIQSQK